MGILDSLFKKNEGLDQNNKSQDLSHLIDGNLPVDWYYLNQDFIKTRDNKLFELSIATSKAQNLKEEKRLLEKFIQFYYEYKDECFSKDECYRKYFTDMHMHCHNSKNSDFEFVTPKEERLKYINDNYDSLLKEEELKKANDLKKEELMIGLKEKVIEEIKNNPGILQSDLYNKFDFVLKDKISIIIYYCNKDGEIIREKDGRTYKLFIK